MPGPARGGITLLGQLAEADGTTTAAQLSLICAPPQQLPSVFNDVIFEALTAPQIVLRSGAVNASKITSLNTDGNC